jgi:hypothetical protein
VSERIEVMPLSFVRERHYVRPINQAYLRELEEKVRRLGPRREYPLLVTPDGALYGGNHRFEVFTKLGISEHSMRIEEPASRDRAALDSNEASEGALPTTFVNLAELVWRKLNGGGATQQAVADELGWSRTQVADYAQLRKIEAQAWSVVATSVNDNLSRPDDVATEVVALATFSENLLRSLLPRKWDAIGRKDEDAVALAAEQQLELVTLLAAGKDESGRTFTKKKFADLADAYHAQAAARLWLCRQLGEIDEDILDETLQQIEKGLYDKEWLEKKGPGPKLEKLLEATRDKIADRHSVQLHCGDAIEEMKKLGDGSIDAVITDPPYNISQDRIFKLSTQPDWNKNFGEWDNKEEADFVSGVAAWAAEFFRVLKPGGSGFMFVGERWLNVSQSLFEAVGFEIRQTFFWCRTNPGPSVTKADFMPAMDYAIQFSKPGSTRTFNYPGDEGGAGLNWQRFPICGGKERVNDKKGNALHPTQIGWMWPFDHLRVDGQTGYNCAIFRNESSRLASEIILEAEDLAAAHWGPNRCYTYVDPRKISSTNPGYCFLKAGWRRAGRSKRGLILLVKDQAGSSP